MLALNINDPVTEQYFNHDPKEVSDLLKAIATSKATIIFNNTGQDIDRLKELQNIDENGNLENGYELQKLSERFKDLDFLYKNLVIKTKEVREEGLKIIKNSDISFKEVLSTNTFDVV